MSGLKSLKTLKNLKLDEGLPSITEKSKKNIPSTEEILNKRKDKRILKSIKCMG